VNQPRVVRGGSWNNNQNNARAAYRNNNHPDNRNNNIGFRVVGVVHSPPFLLWPGPGGASCAAWGGPGRATGAGSGNACQ
jgi:Sulfatase-modifying factor enzyme 1